MKNFLKKQGPTFLGLLIFLWYFHRVSLNFLNPVPFDFEVQEEFGEIISTREFQPHLRIKKLNGEVFEANFPDDLARRKARPLGRIKEALPELTGCKGIIRTQRIKYSLFSEYRVWGLDCGRIIITYSEILRNYKSAENLNSCLNFFGIIFSVLFLLVCYRAMNKRGDKINVLKGD